MKTYKVTITYHDPGGDTKLGITVISDCRVNAVHKVLSAMTQEPQVKFDIIAKELK